mgnify:CR=1 FL=1
MRCFYLRSYKGASDYIVSEWHDGQRWHTQSVWMIPGTQSE